MKNKPEILRRTCAIPAAGFAMMMVLFALVDILNYAQLGKRFTPFSVTYPVSSQTYDETQFYAPTARWFFERDRLRTQFDVFELRNAVGINPVAHGIIIGSIAKLVGSVEVSWVIAHALFPAIIWLLFFFCARMLQLPVAPALLLATATCLVPFGPRNFFLLGQNSLTQPLELARIPEPGLSFAFVLLAITGISRAMASSAIVTTVGAGILIGVNFYTYYYFWVAIGLGYAAWLTAAVMSRRWAEVKTLGVAGLTAVATGLPLFATAAVVMQSQSQKLLLERLGVFSRVLSPTDLALAIILTCMVVALYFRCRMSPLTKALAFVLVGGALGLNFHLLTGFDLQDHIHFMNRVIQPLAFFLCGLVILQWMTKTPLWLAIKQSYWKAFCGLLILVLLGLGAYRQYRVAGAVAAVHDRTQNFVQVIDTLRGRIASGSVVGSTDPQVVALLPALSTLWSFVPEGVLSQASNDEILRRYLLLRKLQGASISDVHADFDVPYPETRSLTYVLFVDALFGDALHAKINQIWPELDLKQDLSVRRLDVLMTNGTPPALPQSTGWQLVKTDAIGKWNILKLQPVNP